MLFFADTPTVRKKPETFVEPQVVVIPFLTAL